MTRLLTVVVATFGTVSAALASPCPGTNLIEDPADFQWTWVEDLSEPNGGYYTGTMEMSEATFQFANGQDLTTRAYGQQGSAPTIPARIAKLARMRRRLAPSVFRIAAS